MTEADIQAAIRLAVGRLPDVKLWRNNTGLLFDASGNPVRFGVGGPGGSDLIGLKRITITPDMIGQRVAVFCAAEVKRPKVKVPANQTGFIEFIAECGGIAGVVRSPDDALALLGAPARAPGSRVAA